MKDEDCGKCEVKEVCVLKNMDGCRGVYFTPKEDDVVEVSN